MQATRRLFRFLAPYRKFVILAPLCMVVEIVMDLLQPRFVQQIIDQGVRNHNAGQVLFLAGTMIGLAIIGMGGGMMCTVYAVRASQGTGADMRRALFAKVQSLSFADLDKWETGSLITRLTNDVAQITDVVMIILRIMVRSPMMLIGSLVMATLTSPQLALIFVALMPLLLGFLVWIVNRTYPIFTQVQKKLDGVNTVMQENLAGVRVVKAFSRAAHEIRRFGTANDALMERNIFAVRVGSLTMPTVMLMMNLGVVAALWFGKIQIWGDALTAGKLLAFVNYLTQALISLMMTSMLVIRLSRAEASAGRIDELLNADVTINDRSDAVTEPPSNGEVAFENVTFGYGEDADSPVLRDISFVARAGETLAILGATGAGKTSLVHLIPRFYDATNGRVTLDGIDVRDISQEALRRRVGIALQETQLFSGTIRENIRYGVPDASDERVVAAAVAAQADEFIRTLPDGYDSPVDQHGANFSGGQKQRLAIARALIVEPSVLILDDSTSAVDLRTEALIEEALKRQAQTKIIVAQRINAAKRADRILVLEDGCLVAEGNHDELMKTSDVYREIHASQVGGGTVDEDGA